MDLQQQMIKLIEHLYNENIITGVSAKDSQTFDELLFYWEIHLKKNTRRQSWKELWKRSLCKRFQWFGFKTKCIYTWWNWTVSLHK